MHVIDKKITLHAAPQEVWAFLATPLNLNELTPPDLEFRILSDLPDKMYNGLMITYEIAIPLFGTHRWLTEIKHINEGVSFVDEQSVGPYKLWYHQHFIEPVGKEMTRMIDRVTYLLPFGPLGRMVHKVKVKHMLEEIFNYRTQRLYELFGEGRPQ
ncbi:MAG: SRPBCC family protein [Deltaproteobacteria bacterium]|jgi:ligand-binding SRPBCC domain-containing protein|nr:SRPBCC family protein [Deltaproteobacteria bacterium]